MVVPIDLRVQDEYAINLQSGKKPYHEGDRASEPLFTYVKPFVFEKPTFAAFVKLLVRTRREKTGGYAYISRGCSRSSLQKQ